MKIHYRSDSRLKFDRMLSGVPCSPFRRRGCFVSASRISGTIDAFVTIAPATIPARQGLAATVFPDRIFRWKPLHEIPAVNSHGFTAPLRALSV